MSLAELTHSAGLNIDLKTKRVMEQVFEYHPVQMAFMTFNVKEKDPNQLAAKEIAKVMIGSRVVVLGFQEIDMSISANIKKSKRITKWEDLLDAEFVRGGTKSSNSLKYMKLASHFMMGIVILMYIDVQLLPQMHDIEATTVSMGVGKIFGNKGGVAVSFCINSTSYLILNCHLLHGETEEDLEKRDKQLISLFHHSSVTLCTVKKQDGSTDEQNFMAADQFNEARDLRFASFLPMDRSALHRRNQENLPIFECYDYIILLGDLNYRIDKATKEDQLKIRMDSDAFILNSNSFEEEKIVFPPSYKYGKGGSLVLDREPSWTDRILISRKYNQGDNLKLNYIKYSSLQDLMLSDHKAVYQVAELCYRAVVDERIGDCLKQYCGTWDQRTREMNPQLRYLDQPQTVHRVLPSKSKLNRITLNFELVCSKSLIKHLVFEVSGLDDFLFTNKVVSKTHASVTEIVSYLDADHQMPDIKRSPTGIILSTYALTLDIDLDIPALLPYAQRVYSSPRLRDLLDKQLSIPLLVTVTPNSDAICLYKDTTIPFFVKIADHVGLYRDDLMGLMNLSLSSINASTLEIVGESSSAATTMADGSIESVENKDPSVLPLLVKLCRTNPDINDLRLLVDFLSYGIFALDCKDGVVNLLASKDPDADPASLQSSILSHLSQRLKAIQTGSERDVIMYRNIRFTLSYMRFLRDRNDQLYRAAAPVVLSSLFTLERGTLAWTDALESLLQ
ncbi:Phosphatidylinositol 5-phosphate phosphatase [Giardia duodenalis]|uniref:Phosphatidylinositol 5-phosphate phosphatase n=1 Tax=Giardia intestinalis TaxID=5741 RepID=V6TD31_GIAIN|nr:Phosphatidylinositol 5-phosphate phosphatase [Giardia intestinalis]